MIRIIETNELHRFDKMTADPIANKPDKPKPQPTTNPTPKPTTTAGTTARKVIQINGARVVTAQASDTPAKLAKAYGISTKQLLQYNDLGFKRNKITDGQYIFVQPKRKAYQGKTKYHKVKEDDTMYSISQRYGIRLKHLYKRNKMAIKQEPAIGAKIVLRGKAKKRPKLRKLGTVRPPKPTPTPKPTPKPTPNPDDMAKPPVVKTHTVKSGDTLWSISQRYQTTVAELKKINNLSSNQLRRGQVLKLP